MVNRCTFLLTLLALLALVESMRIPDQEDLRAAGMTQKSLLNVAILREKNAALSEVSGGDERRVKTMREEVNTEFGNVFNEMTERDRRIFADFVFAH